MGKAQLEELEKHGYYFSVPQGVSMWPLVLNKQGILEIHKLEGPARRYDFVLYTRGEEQGILHRVLHVRDVRIHRKRQVGSARKARAPAEDWRN